MNFMERQEARCLIGNKFLASLVPKVKIDTELLIGIFLVILVSPVWIPWVIITWPIGFVTEKLEERKHGIKTVKL